MYKSFVYGLTHFLMNDEEYYRYMLYFQGSGHFHPDARVELHQTHVQLNPVHLDGREGRKEEANTQKKRNSH